MQKAFASFKPNIINLRKSLSLSNPALITPKALVHTFISIFEGERRQNEEVGKHTSKEIKTTCICIQIIHIDLKRPFFNSINA